MTTQGYFRICCTATVLAAGIAVTMLNLGCQSPGKVVATDASDVCPTCKMQTVTSPVKGLTYTRCVCASCRKETALDPEQEEILRNYVGLGTGALTVHVCEHCKTVVETCPVCRQQ